MNWDELIKEMFIKNHFTDGTYCDVGACRGEYTKLFKSLSTDGGKVFAFEINPKNIEQISHLKSENCIIENKAVCDSDNQEIVVYGNTEDDYQSNILGYDVGYKVQNEMAKVTGISLDTYFRNIKVDFLKIDVEGAELQVIKGGINTIKNCKVVIIECHFDEDWKEIHQILIDNKLYFKNIINDEPVYFRETNAIPGRSSIGRPYQMYLIND
jgi:FkbM family methyltransferase